MVTAQRQGDSWPPDNNEMAQCIRAVDWSATPLGPITGWSASLRITVTTALDSPLPSIVLWGTALTQIYNDAYRHILAQRHPRAMGQDTYACWPEVRLFNEPIYQRVLAHGERVLLQDQEYRLIAPTGVPDLRYFTITYAPARDEHGTVHGVLVVATETTSRVQTERENRRLASRALAAAEQLRLMVDQAPGFVALLRGPQHVFEIANAAILRLTGRQDVVGKPVSVAIPEAGSQGFLALLDTAYATGQPFLASAMPIYLESVSDPVPSLHYLNFVYQPVRDADGVVDGIFVEGNDVTAQVHEHQELARLNDELTDKVLRLEIAERQQHVQLALAEQAQAELRAERDHSRYLLENMTEGFCLIDPAWCVRQVNAEGLRLGRRSRAEVIGKNHWEIWPNVLGTEVELVYRRVRATGKSEMFEQNVFVSDDASTWLEVRVNRSISGDLAIFFHDISTRKSVENALSEVARHKDEFLAMLAHELRNPLAPICTAAKVLSMGDLDRARVRQISGVIARQAAHMTTLIEDLLDVSRVTGGLVTLDRQPFDVGSIVIDAVEQVRALLEARHHQFSVQMPAEASWVCADKERLMQVLANLLNNAARYTPDGGQIALEVSTTESHVLLSVTDNGIGMLPALIPRVFDLFSQAERTADRAQGGLGIGLALVRSLVTLHGGSVTARSDGPDAGSQFLVSLPRLLQAPAQSVGDLPLPDATPDHALRILVVDDNADAADMLAMLLVTAGHQVVVEHASASALESARAASFDLCLLDIGLPEIDGYALARRLQAMPHLAHVPLIAITGYGQPQDRARAASAGFRHHFSKPVDSAELLAVLAQIRRQP